MRREKGKGKPVFSALKVLILQCNHPCPEAGGRLFHSPEAHGRAEGATHEAPRRVGDSPDCGWASHGALTGMGRAQAVRRLPAGARSLVGVPGEIHTELVGEAVGHGALRAHL
jgi:hypothetical protein